MSINPEWCDDCGRLKTELTGYPEAKNKKCWWCEERAASIDDYSSL